MKFSNQKNLAYPRHALIYFLVFCAVNFFLSYFPASLEVKLWVALAVLAPTFLSAFLNLSPAPPGEPLYRRDFLTDLPAAILILLLALFAFFRYCHVFLLPGWPFPDEGWISFFSVEMSQKWSSEIFISANQLPPLFNWLLGAFFKVITPSLVSMRLFTALFFALMVAASWAAARTYFSRSFSFLCVFLAAFSFWPLYTEKFCLPMILILFWQILTFYFLGLFLKAKDSKARRMAGLGLGLCVGTGLFTGSPWPVAAFSVGLAVCGSILGMKGKRKEALVSFLAPVLVFVALFMIASIQSKNGNHIQHLWALYPGMDWGRQLADSFSSLTGIFWGPDFKLNYGPVWGGMLNPVLGSFFLMGLLECRRFSRFPFVGWMAVSLGLFLAPGVATVSMEIFRDQFAIPILLIICAMGIQSLASTLAPKRRMILVSLALVSSIGLDFNHLWISHHRTGSLIGSRIFPEAFEILKKTSETRGKGAVLFDLRSHVGDQTLALATYSFNAARNPNIPLEQVQWVALLLNSDYQPFLAERFPKGEWHRIAAQDVGGRSPEDWILAILPIRSGDRNWLDHWIVADREFFSIMRAISNSPEGKARDEIFERFPRVYAVMKGDPLLESFYWEMVFDCHRWENVFGDKNSRVHYSASREAVLKVLQKGYPTATFYNELGGFYVIEKNYQGARRAFLKAVRSKVNTTPAAENLKALESLERMRGGK